MSGGSFEYMCWQDWHPTEDQLVAMVDAIEQIAPYSEAARQTRGLLARLRQIDASGLRDVWRAVEWWKSGDWGEDQAVEEIERFAALTEAAKHG